MKNQNHDLLVSVVIPHFNHRAYLPQAVLSIVGQTLSPDDFEIIIVNDDPRFNLNNYAKICDGVVNIRVIQNWTRKGQSACLNIGIRLAKGKYVAFQDADDWSTPFRLKESHHQMVIENADFLYGDFIAVRPNKQPLYFTARPWERKNLMAGQLTTAFGSMMVRADVAKKIPFRENIGYMNDIAWLLDLTKEPRRITVLHLPLMYYRQHTSTFRTCKKIPVVRKIKRLWMKHKATKVIRKINMESKND